MRLRSWDLHSCCVNVFLFGGKASVEPSIFGKRQHESRLPHLDNSQKYCCSPVVPLG